MDFSIAKSLGLHELRITGCLAHNKLTQSTLILDWFLRRLSPFMLLQTGTFLEPHFWRTSQCIMDTVHYCHCNSRKTYNPPLNQISWEWIIGVHKCKRWYQMIRSKWFCRKNMWGYQIFLQKFCNLSWLYISWF